MVKRGKTDFVEIPEFKGKVEKAELEDKEFDGKKRKQYHIIYLPLDNEVKELIKDSKTQRLHDFIPISETTTDNLIAEGSNLDNYISEIEYVMEETKNFETHNEVIQYLVGKTFLLKKKKIGRSYAGYEGKEVYIPFRILDQ